MILLISKE